MIGSHSIGQQSIAGVTSGAAAPISLSATLTAQATITASLTVGISLTATLTAQASISADLTTSIQMTAALSAQASISATLATATPYLTLTNIKNRFGSVYADYTLTKVYVINPATDDVIVINSVLTDANGSAAISHPSLAFDTDYLVALYSDSTHVGAVVLRDPLV